MLWLHGAAMLQMLFLGFNPFEEPAWLRTLSGSVFAAGAVHFLWLPLRARLWPEGRSRPRGYLLAAAGGQVLLQALLWSNLRAAGAAVEIAALAGVALLPLLALTAAAARLLPLRQQPPA